MTLIAKILILDSLTQLKLTPHLRQPTGTMVKKNHGGRWYMAEDGHAVYCYGESRLIKGPNGEFIRIATFCRGERAIIKLKE